MRQRERIDLYTLVCAMIKRKMITLTGKKGDVVLSTRKLGGKREDRRQHRSINKTGDIHDRARGMEDEMDRAFDRLRDQKMSLSVQSMRYKISLLLIPMCLGLLNGCGGSEIKIYLDNLALGSFPNTRIECRRSETKTCAYISREIDEKKAKIIYDCGKGQLKDCDKKFKSQGINLEGKIFEYHTMIKFFTKLSF